MNFVKNVATLLAPGEPLLVRKAVRGDKEAFGKLYLKYLDGIYRYIFFKVRQDGEVAEDLAQEVFLKAFKKINGFNRREGTFKAWIYRIARNHTIDYFKKINGRIGLSIEVVDKKENPEERLVIKSEYERLIAAINKLTKVQRDVVILHHVNDLTNAEVAKLLMRNEEAIRAIKYRALKNLKRIYGQNDK